MRFKSKSHGFTSLPNHVIQGFYLSPEALTLLITCLSYPQDWKYRPITIWQSLKISRNKIYEAFDELIQTGHCIRITRKKGNLRGEIDYIFYDDPKLCSEHLQSDDEEFLDNVHSIDFREEFKKFFRHSNGREPEGGEPKQGEKIGIYTYKTNKISIKEDHHHQSDLSSSSNDPQPNDDDDSSKKEKEQEIEVTNLKGQKVCMPIKEVYEKLSKFDRSIVKEAIDKMLSMETPISSIIGYLESTCISIETQRSREAKQDLREDKNTVDQTEKEMDRRIESENYCKRCTDTDKKPISFFHYIEFRHSNVRINFSDPNFNKLAIEQSKSYKDYAENYARRHQISNTTNQKDKDNSRL